MSNKKEYQFKALKMPKVKDLLEGTELLSEADWTLAVTVNNEPHILQFKATEQEEQKHQMEAGVFYLNKTNSGVVANKSTFNQAKLLEKATVTSKIKEEMNLFFDNLEVYERLEILKKRGLLLHSGPGFGKSASVSKTCHEYADNRNTCVFIWPTNDVEPESLKYFLKQGCDWSKIDNFILVAEDIGGFESIFDVKSNTVTPDLLNLLDGIDNVFVKPTFIIGTTNHIEHHHSALSNRPGRFDVVYEVPTLNEAEIMEFYNFFLKNQVENLDKAFLKSLVKDSVGLSIAHIKEICTRSFLRFNKGQESFAEKLSNSLLEIKKWSDDHNSGKVRTGKKIPKNLGFNE